MSRPATGNDDEQLNFTVRKDEAVLHAAGPVQTPCVQPPPAYHHDHNYVLAQPFDFCNTNMQHGFIWAQHVGAAPPPTWTTPQQLAQPPSPPQHGPGALANSCAASVAPAQQPAASAASGSGAALGAPAPAPAPSAPPPGKPPQPAASEDEDEGRDGASAQGQQQQATQARAGANSPLSSNGSGATGDSAGPVEAEARGRPNPSGGDVMDCLTASELDTLIQPMISAHYISAYRLYNVRVGGADPLALARLIRERVAKRGWALAPFHVAHHWATAFFYNDKGGPLKCRVYDSAPSQHTREEFEAIIDKMGIARPEVVTHRKQPRGSNECGVHVVWLAALQSNLAPAPFLPDAEQPGHERVASLAQVRRILREVGLRGMTRTVAGRVVDAAPVLSGATALVSAARDGDAATVAQAPQGGASKHALPSDRPRRVVNPDTACYAIATAQALAHTMDEDDYGDSHLTRLMRQLRGHGDSVPLEDATRAVMQERSRGKLTPLDKVGQQDPHEFITKCFDAMPKVAKSFAVHERGVTSKTGEPDSFRNVVTNQISIPMVKDTLTLKQALDAVEAPGYPDKDTKTSIAYEPAAQHVLLHFRRFDNARAKVATPIRIPLKFTRKGIQYEVTAAVLHHGRTTQHGHYTACVKRADRWWIADDDKEPSELKDPSATLSQAYMVFAKVASSAKRRTAEVIEVDVETDDKPASSTTAVSKPSPACLQPPGSRAEKDAHDLKPGNLIHSSTVDDYIAAMRKAADPDKVTFFDVAQTDSLELRFSKRSTDVKAWDKLMNEYRGPCELGKTLVWVACRNKHYFTMVCRPGQAGIIFFDSLVGAASAAARKLHEAVRFVVRHWRPGATKPAMRHAVKWPQQPKDSNDCALYALSAAWYCLDVTKPIITRDRLVRREAPPRGKLRPAGDAGVGQLTPRGNAIRLELRLSYGKRLTDADYKMKREAVLEAAKPFVVQPDDQRTTALSAHQRNSNAQIEVVVYARPDQHTAAAEAVIAAAGEVQYHEVVESKYVDVGLGKRQASKYNKDKTMQDREAAEVPSYTILKAGAPQRAALNDTQQPEHDMIVMRFIKTSVSMVKCPLCPADDEAAYFAVPSPERKGNVLMRHLKVRHGMLSRSFATRPCKCGKCGAHAPDTAASRDDECAMRPHRDALLCRRCNVWWGNNTKPGHKCIPYKPGVEQEPWPLEAPKPEKAPQGIATWSPSPARAEDDEEVEDTLGPEPADEAARTAAQGDFRCGERGLVRLPPLAAAKAHHLKLLFKADADAAKAIARKGLAHKTRMRQAKLLRDLAAAASCELRPHRLRMPVVEYLLDWTTSKARKQKWSWSTTSGTLSALQSALKYIKLYVPGEAVSWKLTEDVVWQLATRNVRIYADAEAPNQAPIATAAQVLKACQRAQQTNKLTAALIAITWLTCARTGAAVQLRTKDVVLGRTPKTKQVTMVVTIRRGKSNRLGQGPHTVHTRTGEFDEFIRPVLEEQQTKGETWLFGTMNAQARQRMLDEVKDALRTADAPGCSELENRSLRRGALQALANKGASTETLLAFSGHSTVKSLKRYLNFGKIATGEQRKTGRVLSALSKPSTTGTASC